VKSELVVRLIPQCRQILCLLLCGKKNTNEIFRQLYRTGSRGFKHKNNILLAINYLEQAELACNTPDDRHSQIENIDLTPLGRELAELMVDVKTYKESHSDLTKAINKNFNISALRQNAKASRSVLRSKGLPNKVIEQYDKLYDKANELRSLTSPIWIFHLIFIKLISLLPKINFDVNGNVKKYLFYGIVKENTSMLISYMLEDITNYNSTVIASKNKNYGEVALNSAFDTPIENSFYNMNAIIQNEKLFDNILIQNEAYKILFSILSLLKLNPKIINDEIKSLKESVELLEKHKNDLLVKASSQNANQLIDKKIIDHFEEQCNHDRKLLALYEKY